MKLEQLEAATSLLDLDLPGNRLEALQGDRQGQYSIRINEPDGGFASIGPRGRPGRSMLRSLITIDTKSQSKGNSCGRDLSRPPFGRNKLRP